MEFTQPQQLEIDVLIRRRLKRERELFEREMQIERDRHAADLAALQRTIARLTSGA